ncbi:hypothetical protein AVEN_89643-1 [Araneus ventricosus]|uniref:Uncharacterized protein n=1 Tax=Araneus ventricosus TaxID=182803 RepID=A0A4Y2EVW3_ARAVE|nr:hypothetical protein AVEN_89643-1 [Araneus ventricosus]
MPSMVDVHNHPPSSREIEKHYSTIHPLWGKILIDSPVRTTRPISTIFISYTSLRNLDMSSMVVCHPPLSTFKTNRNNTIPLYILYEDKPRQRLQASTT